MRTAWVVLAACAAPAYAQSIAVLAADQQFEMAQAQYADDHHAAAFAAFARLADCGHPQAARIALQMQAYGARLYRMNFDVDPPRLERWHRARVSPAALSCAPLTVAGRGTSP